MKRGSIFNSTPRNHIKKSGFPLSYTNTFTTELARLTPIMCQEVIPGDTMKCDDVIMSRFLPMLSPVMGRIDATVRYFFVPNRLLWSKWSEFITGGADGTLAPVKPYFNLEELRSVNYLADKSLFDYLGVGQPSGAIDEDQVVDAMPFLAYWLIYNEYYRDQSLGVDLQPFIDFIRNSEGRIYTDAEIPNFDDETMQSFGFDEPVNKSWQKDYFTSALPYAQRGPAITIPIGTSAPVTINQDDLFILPKIDGTGALTFNGGNLSGSASFNALDTSYSTLVDTSNNSVNSIGGVIDQDDKSQMYISGLSASADLSAVTGITINELRLLARLQRWSEMNAVGGGRYVEQTLAHWDELIPDYTIQRPQYLGGAKFPVQVSEVLQTAQASTSGTTSSTAAGVGQMYGHGIGVSGKPGFSSHHFTEHGWIIGLISFMPEVSYFQGLPRKFCRFDKFDYAWNELAHLGEQEVLNKEIYINSSNPDGTFGYQSRYAEYKYNNDEIHGDFRTSLLYWTLARKFSSAPALNEDFVTASTLNNRIFAVTDGSFDHILCMCYHNLKSSRKLPKYGQPGIHIL